MFAPRMFSKSVERTVKSINPPLNVEPIYSGTHAFVIAGKVTLSCGDKTYGHCAAIYCMFVASNCQLGTIKLSSALCHLAESNPQTNALGNPTKRVRSLTFTDESFTATKLKTMFDCPFGTGITRHPFTNVLATMRPLDKLPTFTMRLRNKKSFVRKTVGKSPIWIASLKCGFGSTCR